MQNDTISRSALVADLESFKVPMGDPVLRFLVDRVIERVKAQPGVEVAVPVEKSCETCKHFAASGSDYPCYACTTTSYDTEPSRWEAAPDA